MLTNIKSKYIFDFLLSHLIEVKKFELFKYNKIFQKKINISLINYQLYKAKYIINESNIKRKEYNYFNDELIYEGEYLKGKRNGKGKEYDNNGKLVYEGEFLNGERHGKGKEYNKRGALLFEGEYLNGKKWNGNVYECDYREKEPNIYKLINGKGFIKEIEPYTGKILEGEYLNGERNGKGKEYFIKETKNKLLFEGEYLNGKRWNGKGYDSDGTIKYELKEGKGYIKEYNYFGNLIFEGEYSNGERNGEGKEYYQDGKLAFEGEYKNGKKQGKGKEYNKYGNLKFEGLYLYNYKINGVEYNEGKFDFHGDYLFDKKWNGEGYDENGNIIYELNNGTGHVKEYDENGLLLFEGEYLKGKKNGIGKEYIDGKFIFEVNYSKGKIIEKDKVFKYNYLNYIDIPLELELK